MTGVTNDRIVRELLGLYDNDELDVLVERFVPGGSRKVTSEKASQEKIFMEVVRHARRQGWLGQLVDAVAEDRPHSEEMAEMSASMHRDRGRRFSQHLRKELKQTLADVPDAEKLLLTGYRMFAADSQKYTIDDGLSNMPSLIIDRLADAFEPRRLLYVVLYLIRMTAPGETSTNLRSWIETARHTLLYKEIDADEARRFVDEEIARYREMRLHLLVVIRPLSGARFEVTAYRQLINVASEKAHDMVKLDDQPPCTEEDLPRTVRDLVGLMEADRRAIGEALHNETTAGNLAYRMVVELFVPSPLHATAADQWHIVVDPQPLTLCMRHFLVLRSWERSFKEGLDAGVRNSWLHFWELHKGRNRCGMTFNRALFLTYTDLVNAHDVSCSALQFVPTEDDFNVIVMSGTPVGVWTRKPPPSSFMSFVQSILHHPVPGWLESVGDERRKGGAHAPQMTLLWDDADEIRIPPHARFKAQLISPKAGERHD